jgi:hypothetical protein
MRDSELDDFATSIVAKMTANTAYPSPPISMADLSTATTAYSDALALAATGGPQATADKNTARTALLAVLRQEAAYVDTKHGNDMGVLLSSGFHAASTSHAPSAVVKPQIAGIKNGTTGQLLVSVTKVGSVKGVELRYALVTAGTPGAWQSNPMGTKTQNIQINGLTPGQTYTIEARFFGGAAGFSEWSDPQSHMSL